MDSSTVATAPTAEKLPERRLSIICSIGHHLYCSEDVLGRGHAYCSCTCHSEATTDDSFSNFIFTVRSIGRVLSYILSEEEKQARLLAIIESAQGTVDLRGFSSEEVLLKLTGALSRDYWSLAETLDDFGLDRSTR